MLTWPSWSPARRALRRHLWWQAYCGDVWVQNRPFSVHGGQGSDIPGVKAFNRTSKQPLRVRVGREHSFASLSGVLCVQVALGKIPIEWLLRGNSIIFRRKARLSSTKDAAVAHQLFEHIDTEIGHALLHQPTVHKLLIAYTRSWSFYNASEHRIPQGRHVIAATCAPLQERERLSEKVETLARQHTHTHTHIHTLDHGYQREPIWSGRRGRDGRH
jgi:hypothetical protein